ncbi:hypothetical protein OEM_33420 [Mycobacterium intracellulare subsp. yongonense 05-1390]|nr:hypothetical protein OEM_33420 [Mycobacterium intracellulare subsp. yongonense 05-1390]ARR78954.1 hypothetical protein MOTT12_03290 [Mycobacterium intracellulare subsp. yongonense]ARR84024.1 hypothetical protein MOTT27_03203 [Mycobacterium intracellulare subsp. yongonense]ETZ28487.1 hypothetical protein L842_3510 [Mycobacterium intracellulare MIN_052511_1280]
MCGDGHCGGLQGSMGRRPCYRGGSAPSRAVERPPTSPARWTRWGRRRV